MAYENITLERDGAVAVLTINRPKVLNALNASTLREITAAIDEVAADDGVRALVVTGTGDKAFVAGADIREFKEFEGATDATALARRGQQTFGMLEALAKPVIAAVKGFALGGGCELALACDIRIAADSAKMGLPEITLGIIPGYGGTQRLPRLVGKGMAKRMIFSGDMVDAAEALRIGLVDQVVPAEELADTAKKLAAKIASRAPVALALAKQSVDRGYDADLEGGLQLEAANFGLACSTEDMVEGTDAFLEKRKAQFKGK